MASFFVKQEHDVFDRPSNSYGVKWSDTQVSGKRPISDLETYDDINSIKFPRQESTSHPTMNTEDKFTISSFREMVVHLHPHLQRQDVIKMAYLMELSKSFEDELGTSRDPFLFFIKEATMVGKINPQNLDLLIDALKILNKPEDVVKLVTDLKETNLKQPQSSCLTESVWRKTDLQSDPDPKGVEKDYLRYWLKFKDWCSRQNILEAERAPCKKVVEYLFSLTSSIKLAAILNYYKGILQYHQDFKQSDKAKLEICIKEIREQEKKNKI